MELLNPPGLSNPKIIRNIVIPTAIAAAAFAAGTIIANNQNNNSGSEGSATTPTVELQTSVPTAVDVDSIANTQFEQVFIPKFERITKEILPSDTLTPEELWSKYHTRIWNSSTSNLFLRTGIGRFEIMEDLKSGKLKQLDIVLLEPESPINQYHYRKAKDLRFTEEEIRSYLPKELFDDMSHGERDDVVYGLRYGVPVGMLINANDGKRERYLIFISDTTNNNYSEQYNASINESYPNDDESAAVINTIGMIGRHEICHYQSSGEEVFNGMEILDTLRFANALMKKGDDSGFPFVYETIEGFFAIQ